MRQAIYLGRRLQLLADTAGVGARNCETTAVSAGTDPGSHTRPQLRTTIPEPSFAAPQPYGQHWPQLLATKRLPASPINACSCPPRLDVQTAAPDPDPLDAPCSAGDAATPYTAAHAEFRCCHANVSAGKAASHSPRSSRVSSSQDERRGAREERFKGKLFC